MPVSFNTTTAPQIIANEKLGFSFGTPERTSEESLAVVLPILRKTSTKRQYITLPETEGVQINDTGSIDEMRVVNKTDENLFIRAGTIFKGSTQERALLRSAIVYPGKEMSVKVRCVHQSRGIARGASVKYGGVTPLAVDQMNYTSNYTPKSQGDYWRNVSHVSSRMSATLSSAGFTGHNHMAGRHRIGHIEPVSRDFRLPPMAMPHQDDLHSNVENFSKAFDEILRKVKLVENQVGLGLITERGCETIELFDVPLSWSALHSDAIKRLGPNLTKTDKSSVFEYKPENARKAVHDVLMLGFDQKAIFEHRPSNGEPAVLITALTAERYTGEVVEIDGRLMHLMLMRLE